MMTKTVATWLTLSASLLTACAIDGDATDGEVATQVAAVNAAEAGAATILALEATPTAMRLRFTAGDPAITSIAIDRLDAEVGAYHRLAGVTVRATGKYFFDDTTAVPGHEYCYEVVTWVPGQSSGTMSGRRCAVHNGGTGPLPPTAPTNLRITNARERQVRLGFVDASNDETGFTVEQREGNGWTTVAALPAHAGTGTDLSVYVGDLDVEEHYCYRVRASGAGGSSVTLQTTCGDTTPIFAQDPILVAGNPGLIRIVHPAPGQLQAQWLDEAGHRHWEVDLIDGLTWATPIGTAHVTDSRPEPLTHQSVTFQGLTPGHLYCIQVRQMDNYGANSARLCEAPKAARTSVEQRDPAVGFASILGGANAPGNKLMYVSFDYGVDGQVVERVTAATGQRETIFATAGQAGTVEDTGLVPGTTYCYRAVTFNAYGARYTDFVCATTKTDLPMSPQHIVADVSGQTINLHWDPAWNADDYKVHFVGKRSGYTDHHGDRTTTGTSISITGYEGDDYCFQVTARNQFGSSGTPEKCDVHVVDDGVTTYWSTLVSDVPYEGYVLYWDTLPHFAGSQEYLTKVEILGTLGVTQYEVQFLVPGTPREACGTNVGVTVQAGGFLQGADLATLYGSAQPPLPVTLEACKVEFIYTPDITDVPIVVTTHR